MAAEEPTLTMSLRRAALARKSRLPRCIINFIITWRRQLFYLIWSWQFLVFFRSLLSDAPYFRHAIKEWFRLLSDFSHGFSKIHEACQYNVKSPILFMGFNLNLRNSTKKSLLMFGREAVSVIYNSSHLRGQLRYSFQ